MSLTARLFLKGHQQEEKGIKVLSCNFSFTQSYSADGFITGKVRAGLINISIPGINDTELVQWMIFRDMQKEGKICFYGIDPQTAAPQETKTLSFKDGILVNYYESFTDESDMTINLSISARSITLSNASWETQWDVYSKNS
ncbi:MAG: type VI secretion system tube protein TssD [Prolixibacteraceae bacterium]|nr:type VI secretion system tube protein TssD [Prolixibacteraceae bacterium]